MSDQIAMQANAFIIKSNHLQEQQWERNEVPLRELYSGARGRAFKVPKI